MSAPEAAPEPKPSRASRLLGLVRQLIAYGRQLAETIRSNPHPVSASDIALILARITRGLLLAEALETRIIRTAARLDAETAPPRPPSHRRSPPARAGTVQPTDTTGSSPALVPAPKSAALCRGSDPGMPTAEQIAIEIRRRPIGAVIADICRDLGILPSHPLWRELSAIIVRYGGNLANLVKDILDRILGPLPSARSLGPAPAPALQFPAHFATGPP